jgi:hypothetical protein
MAYAFCVRCGLRFDPGVGIILALPPLFLAGPWIGLVVLAAVAAWAAGGRVLLSQEEKSHLLAGWRQSTLRLRDTFKPLASSRPT